MESIISFARTWRQVSHHYRVRKELYEPDLCAWEFFIQMLVSAYLSWRWLGSSAAFRPFSLRYWTWLAAYSSLSELSTRAQLAHQTNHDVRRQQVIRVGPAQRFIEVEWP